MLRIWRCDCAALRHWKRVSMPPTTQSLRHPLTRAHHIAPRIKTTRRFTAKNPWWWHDFLVKNRIKFLKTITNILVGTWYFTSAYNQYNTLNINYLTKNTNCRIPPRIMHSGLFYSRFRIIWFLKIGFSPKASGFYPVGDATDLVRGLFFRQWYTCCPRTL